MSVEGRIYPELTFAIGGAQVGDFARAVSADPTAGIPPTYAAVYALRPTFGQLLADPEAEVNLDLLVHSEQDFEWERHPEVGETLRVVASVDQDVIRRGLRLLTMTARCRDEAGSEVCRSRMTCVVRPAQL